MGKDLFKYLPSEIILNILLRLPTPTTMSCKCVCKPWLVLLETPEFVKSHLSKPVSGLVVFIEGKNTKPYKVFEFVDEVEPRRRVCRWKMVFNFNLPCNAPTYSSADGLLFLCTRGMVSKDVVSYSYVKWPRDLFICNPITREYIKLPCPPESSSSTPQVQMDTFGFGLSRMSGQYKLVRIFHEWKLVEEAPELSELGRSKCQVYTVGTRSWSRVCSAGPYKYEGNAKGAFVNGNLHWMVHDFEGPSVWISCFDLETELFSTFTPPPCHHDRENYLTVSALKDCLCLCDNSADDEIVIWLMKEYGVEKSWTKEFVIRKSNLDYNAGLMCPIKAFKNGDSLMALEILNYDMLLYFPRRTKTISPVEPFELKSAFYSGATSYTPSFLPLETYVLENVTSF